MCAAVSDQPADTLSLMKTAYSFGEQGPPGKPGTPGDEGNIGPEVRIFS